MIQAEIEYHEKILGFIEEAKSVYNMQYSLLLINNTKKRLRNLQKME